jgi:hypothetical protein
VADQREAILSRLVAVCGAVSGVNAVGRNRLDVGAMLRPAVIILDGSESFVNAPSGTRIDVIQRMELSPAIVLALRGDDGAEAGTLMSLYRSRIIAAVLGDAELAALVLATAPGMSAAGGMRYGGCTVAIPDAEAKEHRIDLHMHFTYVFQISDIAA